MKTHILAVAAFCLAAVGLAYEPPANTNSFTREGVTYAQRGGLGSSDFVVTNIDASAVGAVKSVNGLKGDVVLNTANIKHGYSSLQNVINSVEGNTLRHIDNKNNPHAVTAAQVGAVPKVLKAVDMDVTVRELNDEGDIIIKGQDGSDVLQVTVGKEANNYTSSIYVDDFVDLTIGGVRSWGEYGLSSSAKKKLDVKTFTSTSNEFARKLGELENADERNFNTLDDKVKDIKYIARAFDVWKTNNYVAVGKDADGYAIKEGQVTHDSQVAIGEGAKAVEDRAIAIGKQSRASGVDSVAVGTKASSNGRGTVVIGNATAIAGQDRAVVIGSIGDEKLMSNGSDTFTVSAEDLSKFYFRDKTLKSLIDDNLPTNAASKSEMEETKAIVQTWEGFLDGSNVVFSITNYISGAYLLDAAKLRILDLRDGKYHEVYNSRDEILLHLKDFKDNDFKTATNQVIGAVNSAIENKADRAWGKYTSAGGEAPSNTVYMTAPNTVFAGGMEYERVAVGEGTICVLTTHGANVWTQGDEGTFKFQDDGGTNYFGFAKNNSYTIGCNTDGISVQSQIVTLTYDVTMSGVPCVWYCPSLDAKPLVWEQLNTADGEPIAGASHTVSWDTNPPVGKEVCYINCPEPKGFFKATIEVAGSAKFMTNMPADLSAGIICTDGIHKVAIDWNNGSPRLVEVQ